MPKITLIPSNIEFASEQESTILAAALKENIFLEHSCSVGNCGSCKVQVISGDVQSNDPYEVLTVDETNNNIVLTCCSKTMTDCEIKAVYYAELSNIKRKVVAAKVNSIDFPAVDIAIVKLRLPPTARFDYLPGQYVHLSFQGVSRSYSIANAQEVSKGIELHIREVPDGEMSKKIFQNLKENDLVRLDGPVGTFFVHDSERPVIFLAGGTGFAPVKAMVEALIEKGSQRPIYIYWGSQTVAGLYSEQPYEWEQQNFNVRYIPVISGNVVEWEGRTGYVHSAVLEDFDSLSTFDIYACGSPLMINAAQSEFINKHHPSDQFYSDAFVASLS